MIQKLLKNKLTYLFFFCLVDIFLYQGFLIKILQKTSFASALGEIQYRICLAMVTSYIFYTLVTFNPKENDKKKVYSYVNPKKDKVISTIKNFFKLLVQAANEAQLKDSIKQGGKEPLFQNTIIEIDSLTEKDINEICLKIDPSAYSPIHLTKDKNDLRPLTWEEYIRNHVETIIEQINDLFVLMPHLDVKHTALLGNLKETTFIELVRTGNVFAITAPTIEVLGPYLYEYYTYIFKLEREW